MSAYDDLLAALEAERHNGSWWTTPHKTLAEMDAAWERRARCEIAEAEHNERDEGAA